MTPPPGIRECDYFAGLDERRAVVAYQSSRTMLWTFLGAFDTSDAGAFRMAIANGTVCTVQCRVEGGYALLAWRCDAPQRATAAPASVGLSDTGRYRHRLLARYRASQ